MSSTHSANWRAMSNTEVKNTNGSGDSSSTRAYSAAVRILKPKGGSNTVTSTGIIIPKGTTLKKKSPHGN